MTRRDQNLSEKEKREYCEYVGKQLNPKTMRCVKKCKAGKAYNANTNRCVKFNKSKPGKSKSLKSVPDKKWVTPSDMKNVLVDHEIRLNKIENLIPKHPPKVFSAQLIDNGSVNNSTSSSSHIQPHGAATFGINRLFGKEQSARRYPAILDRVIEKESAAYVTPKETKRTASNKSLHSFHSNTPASLTFGLDNQQTQDFHEENPLHMIHPPVVPIVPNKPATHKPLSFGMFANKNLLQHRHKRINATAKLNKNTSKKKETNVIKTHGMRTRNDTRI